MLFVYLCILFFLFLSSLETPTAFLHLIDIPFLFLTSCIDFQDAIAYFPHQFETKFYYVY